MTATKNISAREYRDSPVFWFVRLDKAREANDHEQAAEALRELRRLGVVVYFRPQGTAQ